MRIAIAADHAGYHLKDALAARLAGRYPNTTPVAHEIKKAVITDKPEIGIVIPSGRKGRAIKGILIAIAMPKIAPVPLIMRASSKN